MSYYDNSFGLCTEYIDYMTTKDVVFFDINVEIRHHLILHDRGWYSPWSFLWSRDVLSISLNYYGLWLFWRDRDWFDNVVGYECIRNGWQKDSCLKFEEKCRFTVHQFRLRPDRHQNLMCLNLLTNTVLDLCHLEMQSNLVNPTYYIQHFSSWISHCKPMRD